jgi:hypothetical protein
MSTFNPNDSSPMKLKYVPKHIRDLIIDEQAKRNKACINCRISKENTIYRIIEEWATLKGIYYKHESDIIIDNIDNK